MIFITPAMNAEAAARVFMLRLYPGERVPYITGRVK